MREPSTTISPAALGASPLTVGAAGWLMIGDGADGVCAAAAMLIRLDPKASARTAPRVPRIA
jgi:hypothetical protein